LLIYVNIRMDLQDLRAILFDSVFAAAFIAGSTEAPAFVTPLLPSIIATPWALGHLSTNDLPQP
jgi:hypothetical protein